MNDDAALIEREIERLSLRMHNDIDDLRRTPTQCCPEHNDNRTGFVTRFLRRHPLPVFLVFMAAGWCLHREFRSLGR